MASPDVDLTLEQGATYAFGMCWGTLAVDHQVPPVPILGADGLQTSEPYDLSGCTARLQMRFKQKTDVLLTCTTEDTNGGITLTPPSKQGITSFDVTANVVTAFLSSPHDLAVGDIVSIDVTVPGGGGAQIFQGFWTVTVVPDSTTFKFARVGVDGTYSGVTATVVKCGDDNITIVLSDESTDALVHTTSVWDCKIYWPNGDEDYVVHGNVSVRLRVTQDVAP